MPGEAIVVAGAALLLLAGLLLRAIARQDDVDEARLRAGQRRVVDLWGELPDFSNWPDPEARTADLNGAVASRGHGAATHGAIHERDQG